MLIIYLFHSSHADYENVLENRCDEELKNMHFKLPEVLLVTVFCFLLTTYFFVILCFIIYCIVFRKESFDTNSYVILNLVKLNQSK